MIEYYKIPIFSYSFDDWGNVKKTVLEKLSEYKKDHHIYNERTFEGTTLKTDYHIYKGLRLPPYGKDLIEIVTPYVKQFKQDANLSANYMFNGMWYESVQKDEYHGKHDHGKRGISAVWYIEMSEEQKPTEFLCEFGFETLTPNVKEGDILFFPAWLKHRGGVNPLNKERVIVSFNLVRSGRDYPDQYFYDGACVHV